MRGGIDYHYSAVVDVQRELSELLVVVDIVPSCELATSTEADPRVYSRSLIAPARPELRVGSWSG